MVGGGDAEPLAVRDDRAGDRVDVAAAPVLNVLAQLLQDVRATRQRPLQQRVEGPPTLGVVEREALRAGDRDDLAQQRRHQVERAGMLDEVAGGAVQQGAERQGASLDGEVAPDFPDNLGRRGRGDPRLVERAGDAGERPVGPDRQRPDQGAPRPRVPDGIGAEDGRALFRQPDQGPLRPDDRRDARGVAPAGLEGEDDRLGAEHGARGAERGVRLVVADADDQQVHRPDRGRVRRGAQRDRAGGAGAVHEPQALGFDRRDDFRQFGREVDQRHVPPAPRQQPAEQKAEPARPDDRDPHRLAPLRQDPFRRARL